jgi:hypothetical protein
MSVVLVYLFTCVEKTFKFLLDILVQLLMLSLEGAVKYLN